LLVFCLLAESPPIDAVEQREIDARDLIVARAGRRPGLALPRGGREAPLRQWGLELLERIEPVAELLGRGGEAHAEAVAAQRKALEHPEATPSARQLAEIKAGHGSFFEHSLELARRHHAHFASRRLTPERDAELEALALASLAEQRRLEEQDRSLPFDAFLARYFSES
ncbi:MAG TPA: glutamate--cysteine ligase, partial [Gammaproteobacteria bacterium]|nr:glutamate--cysteine ligase [Gammaproteobacteria bacterium]